jgi:hypothetical protein
MLRPSFYVTTQEIEHPEREHNYRLPQGETLPEDHRLKSQKKAGEFKFAQVLSPESLHNLLTVK